ncbi:MAG TPA: ATP-binding protein, partial [Bacteroidales bacterium]|nr:ATP-binding protein [Bacteroidales bacterium]
WTKSELELLRSFSGIVANAYERRISERSLQESEAKNRAILQSIPDILFHFNKEGKILSYSSSSVEDLALRPDFFVGKLIAEIFPEEFSSKVLLAIETCLNKGSYKFDYVLSLRGDLNDYEARMSKMSNNEVIAIVRNVSERKNYERQLTAERDRANQANKAKSEFLANMSHEIRTPMNAILGFSEALFHKLETPQHKKMLQSILSSGNLLLSLLNDILDLSKIEAGMLEISHQPVDLVNIIKEIKLLFLSKAEKKNVEINLYYPEDFPHLLMLDEIRIKQVIFNLVGNAIKFTHVGYVNISLSFDSGPDFCGQLRIDVADTGIGIPESQQQVIFETFRQQSGQSNRMYEGAGLGLAISKRLVEKMFGEISVKSEVGKGSTFSVVLPSSYINYQDTVPEEATDEDVQVLFDPCNILVVDDVASNIDAVESLLDNSGINISRAESGAIALEILKYMQPKLILLDIRMPDMNGYDVARKVKEDKRFAAVPIIAYTASVFGSDHGPDSSDFDGYLFKPVDKSSLIKEFKKYLKYQAVESANVCVNRLVATLDNIPSRLKVHLPEIYNHLMVNSMPKWELVKDHLILYKIEEFAVELKQMAGNYEFEFLVQYASTLMEELETVDLESLQKSLLAFPEIVNNISKLINK